MLTTKLDLFGGRISCIKFAIHLAIKLHEEQGNHDMTRINWEMLNQPILVLEMVDLMF